MMNLLQAYELKSSCLSDLLIYSQNQTAFGLAPVSLQIQTDLLTVSQLCAHYGEAETHVPRGGLRKYMKY
jgi:hypothetical protein